MQALGRGRLGICEGAFPPRGADCIRTALHTVLGWGLGV